MLQSYEKSSEIQNKLVCFYFRDGVTSSSLMTKIQKKAETSFSFSLFCIVF